MGPRVGFGHTLLATTDDGTSDRQPRSFDDIWITADARIDGRTELVAALAAAGQIVAADAADAGLLLHAYRAWGEGCVDRLLGDFSFGIWDGPNRRLFCARDHFGVKPFFYAQPRSSFVFSNTIECVRRHPGVSGALDDLSIADFLLFTYNQRLDATAFADIRRLPPGHALTWSPGSAPVIRQYWKLTVEAELRYRDRQEYVDQFNHLFRAAVGDRLRTRQLSVSMSGGLDSSAIAAMAKSVLAGDGRPFEVRAHTMVLDEAVPDEERHYAGLVANRLGIPIDYFAADDYAPFPSAGEVPHELPEPGDSTFRTLDLDFSARIASTGRVVLSGMDADAFLGEHTLDYFAALIRRRRLGSLAKAMGQYAVSFRRRPPLGIRRMLGALQKSNDPSLPPWLASDFARNLHLQERAREVFRRPPMGNALRPRPVRTSATTLWTTVFGRGDAECTRQPLEYRYPFADVRLVRYLLAVPVVPWCTDKTLLREALKGLVPESVRRRRKTPLAIDPLLPALRHADPSVVDRFEPAAPLARYVERRAVPRITGETSDDVYVNLRPLCLSRWLDRQPI
jgi:asparagine synthase (glutamine-hydrolysing)